MTTYYKRRAAGLCPGCGGERDKPGRLMCSGCIEASRVRYQRATPEQRRREAEKNHLKYMHKKENGLCVCGRPVAPGWRCCEMHRQYRNDRYEGFKAAGLCVECGLPKEDDKHVLCRFCRGKRREYMQRKREENNGQ